MRVIVWGRISIYACLVVDAQTTINHNVMVMEMTTRCQIVRHLVGKNALSRDQARQRRLAAGRSSDYVNMGFAGSMKPVILKISELQQK